MDKRITTVCGDIDASSLGFTSTHEHIIHDFTRCVRRFRSTIMPPDFPQERLELVPRNFTFLKDCNTLFSEDAYLAEDLDVAAFEVEEFKRLGGQAIVDAGALDIRGNVEVMRELSIRTGVHIICSTGLYQYVAWPDELMDKDANYLARVFLDEIENGIGETGIKPGAVKAAVGSSASMPDVTFEREMTNVRAGAIAARESGLPLMVHTSQASPTTEDEVLGIIDAVEECGLPPERLYMCHMDTHCMRGRMTDDYVAGKVDREIEISLILRVLDRGANIGFDTWGNPYVPPMFVFPDDNDRLRALHALLELGYSSQIVLGNDFLCPRVSGVQVGGFGMTRVAGYAVPYLKRLGFDEEVKTMTVDNPSRIFAR